MAATAPIDPAAAADEPAPAAEGPAAAPTGLAVVAGGSLVVVPAWLAGPPGWRSWPGVAFSESALSLGGWVPAGAARPPPDSLFAAWVAWECMVLTFCGAPRTARAPLGACAALACAVCRASPVKWNILIASQGANPASSRISEPVATWVSCWPGPGWALIPVSYTHL